MSKLDKPNLTKAKIATEQAVDPVLYPYALLVKQSGYSLSATLSKEPISTDLFQKEVSRHIKKLSTTSDSVSELHEKALDFVNFHTDSAELQILHTYSFDTHPELFL